MKLMILDDDPNVRLNLKLYLSDEGYDCHEYGCASRALESIHPGKFNAAIVDIALPGIFGDEFILKANELDPDLQYIIYTGHISFSLPKELRNIGMKDDSVIYKPVIDMKTFKDRISFLTTEAYE